MDNIIIKKDALQNIHNYIDVTKKSLIVSDSGVPNNYIEILKKQLCNGYVIIIEQGEHHKTIESYQKIVTKLLEKEFTRHDQIIALGGGIVCDITGFVAGTYKRGIDFINIPTTTLSMIDASVGGKTAINFNCLKNVIGLFYNAKKVIIDSTLLNTLSPRHYYNGLVEALKMGLCLNKNLYEIFLEDHFENKIDSIIEQAIKTKLKVVNEDPFEKNLRKVLNFGHTIGHAIESFYLDEIYHGEAVGIGMLFAIRNLEIKDKLKEILTRMHINYQIAMPSKDQLVKLIANDKKKNKQTIDFIELIDVEKYQITPFTVDDIIKIIEGGY